jgi:hypothetical protein
MNATSAGVWHCPKADTDYYYYPKTDKEERLLIDAGYLHVTQPIIPKPRDEPLYTRPFWFIVSEVEGYGGV